jgi:glycosyltransferase involved in cell wall biosynthesis
MNRKVVHYIDSAAFGGNEQALLHLLEYSDRDRWQPVLFHQAEPGLARFIGAAQRLEVRTQVVPRMKGKEAISGLPRFIQLLRRENPAIFHAHLNWLLSCKFGLMASALAGIPHVVATLQQYLLPPWGRSTFLQQRFVSERVDRYIAVSNAIARQLSEDFHVPTTKIEVIHNSIPAERFNRSCNPALRKELSRETAWPVVLTVARLDEQKGHKFLLQAVSQLPEAIFALVGEGPERASLEAQADRLGISDQVLFLGFRQDVPDLLACCDLFVLPSVYEGLPLSVLEAMAAGKPVVATAVGGTPEAVVDGETGFLVPPGDPQALAISIQTALENSKLLNKLGEEGKKRAQKEFSVEIMSQTVIQVYEELLGFREGFAS